jgi:hypothetical protein
MTTRGFVNVLIKTYLKIGNISNDCHPREGGGPLKFLGNMDSRLRENDAPNEPIGLIDYEIGSGSLRFSEYSKTIL